MAGRHLLRRNDAAASRSQQNVPTRISPPIATSVGNRSANAEVDNGFVRSVDRPRNPTEASRRCRRKPAGYSDAFQPSLRGQATVRFTSSHPPAARCLSSNPGERQARLETANASGSRSPPPQTRQRPERPPDHGHERRQPLHRGRVSAPGHRSRHYLGRCRRGSTMPPWSASCLPHRSRPSRDGHSRTDRGSIPSFAAPVSRCCCKGRSTGPGNRMGMAIAVSAIYIPPGAAAWRRPVVSTTNIPNRLPCTTREPRSTSTSEGAHLDAITPLTGFLFSTPNPQTRCGGGDRARVPWQDAAADVACTRLG